MLAKSLVLAPVGTTLSGTPASSLQSQSQSVPAGLGRRNDDDGEELHIGADFERTASRNSTMGFIGLIRH